MHLFPSTSATLLVESGSIAVGKGEHELLVGLAGWLGGVAHRGGGLGLAIVFPNCNAAGGEKVPEGQRERAASESGPYNTRSSRRLSGFAGDGETGAAPEVARREEEDGRPENKRRTIGDENDQKSGEAMGCIREAPGDGVAKLRGDGFDGGIVLFAKREMDI